MLRLNCPGKLEKSDVLGACLKIRAHRANYCSFNVDIICKILMQPLGKKNPDLDWRP